MILLFKVNLTLSIFRSNLTATPSTLPTAAQSSFALPNAFTSSNPFSNFTGLVPSASNAPKTISQSENQEIVRRETMSEIVTVDSKQAEFNMKLKKLNATFFQWVSRQIEEHPLSLWKDGLKVTILCTLKQYCRILIARVS